MRALALALAVAVHAARAEVSVTIPAPPKAPPTAGELERDTDLTLDREAWLAELAKVRGARVTAWSQGADVNCPAETRARLEREGYSTHEFITVMDEAVRRKRPLPAQYAEAMGGGLKHKAAVRLAPGIWIALTPRPGAARITCYLHREFRLPVGGVCAEVDLGQGGLGELAQVIGLARRAAVSNGIRPGPASKTPASR